MTQPQFGCEPFLIEAQATARCHHYHIVVIHDVGECRDNPYLVLEHLQGTPLGRHTEGCDGDTNGDGTADDTAVCADAVASRHS